MLCVKNSQMPHNVDGQAYLYDFLMEGENFFNESHFHLERTYGTKAAADISLFTPPTEGEFIDVNEEFHSTFRKLGEDVMYAPRDLNITKQVIGRKGYGFISITEKSGVDFIWYDKDTNTIRIRGPEENLYLAKKMISHRIRHYVRRMKNQNRFVLTNACDHHVPCVDH